MNISRKEFFRKSLMSLGEAVCTVGDALKAPAALPMEIRDPDNCDATPMEELVAVAHNERCLARNCGCFSCAERCDTKAIKIIPGVGIRINQRLCVGCSSCHYVCPVTPKAVTLIKRQTE
jgi:MinD superfamily P-loop ATPase